jgi:MFS family permease
MFRMPSRMEDSQPMAGSSDLRTKGFVALMVTVFINALNDNFFRLVIIFVAIREFVAQDDDTFHYSLVGFVFLLPFVVFSPYAGFVADRYSKKQTIVWTRFAEALVLITGGVMLILHNMVGLFISLFLMGLQSTFFSPVKFGILPEIVRSKQLSRANGHMQLWTFLAIILGTALAGFLMDLAGDALWIPAMLVILVSLLGLLSSVFVTPTKPEVETAPFRLNPFGDVFHTIGEIRRTRVLFLVILGIAYFWALGTLYQLNVPLFAELELQVGEFETGILLTLLAVGIGVGSIASGYLAKDGIALRHVPAGVFATSMFSMLFYVTADSPAWTLALTVLLGIGAGFFIVPISAYLQERSPPARRGRFIAASNFLAFAAMLAAPVAFWVLTGPLGMTPAQIFVVAGVLSLLAVVWGVREYRRAVPHEAR